MIPRTISVRRLVRLTRDKLYFSKLRSGSLDAIAEVRGR